MGTPRLPRAERRRRILDQAVTLFAEKGPAAATTAALAGRAGVAEPVLYRHFGSKRGVLEAVISEVLLRVRGGMVELRGPASAPEEALERLVRGYPGLSRRLAAESRIVARALAEGAPGAARRALQKHYQAHEDFLAGLIKEGQRRKAIRTDIPAASAAWHLIHAAVGFQLTSALGPARKDRESHWARLLMDGLKPR